MFASLLSLRIIMSSWIFYRLTVLQSTMVIILSYALLVSTLVRESPVTLLQHHFSSSGFVTLGTFGGTNLKRLPSSQLDMIPCSRQLVQFSSVAQLCLTLCDSMNRSTPGLPVHHQFRSSPKPIDLVMPSNHLILFCPLLILPSIS